MLWRWWMSRAISSVSRFNVKLIEPVVGSGWSDIDCPPAFLTAFFLIPVLVDSACVVTIDSIWKMQSSLLKLKKTTKLSSSLAYPVRGDCNRAKLCESRANGNGMRWEPRWMHLDGASDRRMWLAGRTCYRVDMSLKENTLRSSEHQIYATSLEIRPSYEN